MNQTKPDFLLVGKPFHIFDMVYLDEQEVFDLYKKMGFDFIHMLSGDFYVEIQEGDSRFLVNNGLPVYVNLDDASFHRYIPKQHSLDRVNETFLLMSKLRPSYNIAVNEFLLVPPGFSNMSSYYEHKRTSNWFSYYCFQTMFDNYRRIPEYSIMETKNDKVENIKNHSLSFNDFHQEFEFRNIECIISYYFNKFSKIYKNYDKSILLLSSGIDSKFIHFLMDLNEIEHMCYSYSDSPFEREIVYKNSKNLNILDDSYFLIDNKTLYNIWKKYCIKCSGLTAFFNSRSLTELILLYKNDFNFCFDGSDLIPQYGTYFFKKKEKRFPECVFDSNSFSLEKRIRGFFQKEFKKFPIADKVLFEFQKKWNCGNRIKFYNKLYDSIRQYYKLDDFFNSKCNSTTIDKKELNYAEPIYNIELIEKNEEFEINFHFLSVLLYLMENVFDVDYDTFDYVYKNFNKKAFKTSDIGVLNILKMGMLSQE